MLRIQVLFLNTNLYLENIFSDPLYLYNGSEKMHSIDHLKLILIIRRKSHEGVHFTAALPESHIFPRPKHRKKHDLVQSQNVRAGIFRKIFFNRNWSIQAIFDSVT